MSSSTQQFTLERELSAPIERCFQVLIDPAEMKSWIAGAERIEYDHSSATEPYFPGSVRQVIRKNGAELTERITDLQPPFECAYAIDSIAPFADALLSNYRAVMTLEAISSEKTRLHWWVGFDCAGLQKLTAPLMKIAAKQSISTMADDIQQYILSSSVRRP